MNEARDIYITKIGCQRILKELVNFQPNKL